MIKWINSLKYWVANTPIVAREPERIDGEEIDFPNITKIQK